MDMGDRRVIIGIGRSAGGYQALRYAVDEARRRDGIMLAVRAFRRYTYDKNEFGVGLQTQWALAEVDAAFAEALGGWPPDLEISAYASEGDPARTLLSIADRASDLLVIGGCGARRFAHLRSTAVARLCAREATCPLVIIPPAAWTRSARPDRLARGTTRDVENFLNAQ
jgi:nucleotide-binding universal stress UspA family protein